MARMSDLLGGTKKQDLFRLANNEKIPYRGKKKHGSQMTNEEKQSILKALKSVKKWKLSSHALDRLVGKGIKATYNDIVSTIHNAVIIEFHLGKHNDQNDSRVLLRANTVVNDNYNLNVVYSLTRKEIVSVWLNEVNDKHYTLDMSQYTKGLKIAL